MKDNKVIILFVIVVLCLIEAASAAHYITGYANNAFDGTGADGYEIVLWNPANGISDNVSDIIGPFGNSGASNIYFVDCEMLDIPCDINDILNIKVINNGSGYNSPETSVTVTGSGFDVAPDLRLNSPPNSSLITPVNYYNTSSIYVNFSCKLNDFDSNLDNVTLYGNWPTGWHANETKAISGNEAYINFNKTISEGIYEWNCLVNDNLSSSRFSNRNYSLVVDTSSPVIKELILNLTGDVCGLDNIIKVRCNATDTLSDIKNVVIEANSPYGRINYSGIFFEDGIYYADILINDTGVWNFSCMAEDHAGNFQRNESTEYVYGRNLQADLRVSSDNLVFSENNPIENQEIDINITIFNDGCQAANDFLVGFYEGDPDISAAQIKNNLTTSVDQLSNSTINISWNAKIGINNIFLIVDVSDVINEYNESNNRVNRIINVTAWQNFYGNLTVDIILSDDSYNNMSFWLNKTNLGGNVFFIDKESNIDWKQLQAIGKNSSGSDSGNDFTEMDNLFNMSDFSDSISKKFSIDGSSAKLTEDFLIHQREVFDVPIINSTLDSIFITGILWDMSDDETGEFDYIEKEDIVFVTTIKQGMRGAYGFYDYEINIPARIRDYNGPNNDEVFIYFDLE